MINTVWPLKQASTLKETEAGSTGGSPWSEQSGLPADEFPTEHPEGVPSELPSDELLPSTGATTPPNDDTATIGAPWMSKPM